MSERRRLLSEPVPALLAAGFVVALSTVVVAGLDQWMWSSRVVLLPLAAGIGLPLLGSLLRSSMRVPAMAALAWMTWCLVSATVAPQPAMAFWGVYGVMTGALFVAACAGLWAVGARSGPRGAVLVEKAIVLGAVVNALVAVLEMVVDLHRLGIPSPGVQASALFGNPAFFAAFVTGATWVAIRRVPARPVVGGLLVFLFATGLQLSAERLALALLVVMCVIACVAGPRRSGVVIVAAAVLGLGAGYALAHVGSNRAPTSVERAIGDVGMTARIESWISARHAIAERPLTGFGPGRYHAATSPLRTLRMASVQPTDEAYADAHNVIVEYAVTTGVPGLVLFCGFLGLAFFRARSQPVLGGFALLVFVAHLLQPQHVGVTPILLLVLGVAAGARHEAPRLNRPDRVLLGGGVAVGLVASSTLAAGFFLTQQAARSGRLPDLRSAQRLLPPWPELALAVAHLRYLDDQTRGLPPDVALERLLAADRAAAELDPTNIGPRVSLAYEELRAKQYDAARADFEVAIKVNPWSTLAANGLGVVAAETGDTDEAIRWFSRSLRAHPDQPAVRKALEDLRAGPGR